MITTSIRRTATVLTLVGLSWMVPTHVLAGSPLICHPYNIGAARSLPSGTDAHGASAAYDRRQLVPDTLALLHADTPLLVRMETLRLAAIYATGKLRTWNGEKYTRVDQELAAALILELRQRTHTTDSKQAALALFDLGFFTETIRQTGLDPALDGYPLLVKAAETLSGNPDLEFALALATWSSKRPEHASHLAKARAAARAGSLLAANLESHFGKS